MDKHYCLGWIISILIFSATLLLPVEGSFICPEEDFRCRDGECIHKTSRCDRLFDCEDSSDEENCVTGCRFPRRLHHGSVVYAKRGDVQLYEGIAPENYLLRFQCRKGYELAGSRNIFCAQGEWTDTFPLCVQLHCRNPPSIGNGTYHIIKGVSRLPVIGSTATYSCLNAFELEDENATSLTCTLNGTSAKWTGELPRCKETDECPDPGVSPHGRREGNCCFKGDILKFTCNKGYATVGQQEIECLAGGSWSAPRTRCRPPGITCPDPPDIQNGNIRSERESDFYLPDDDAMIVCNEGFSIRGGSDLLYCYDDGEWDGVFGRCEVVPCKFPEIPLNGSIPQLENTNQTMFPHGFGLTYQCNEGFRLSGTSWNVCKGRRWAFEAPKCEVIRCYDPGTPENGRKEGDNFDVGSKVIYSCFSGYTLLGSDERYCLKNGQWSGELSRCDSDNYHCPQPGKPINGMRTGSRYDEGDVVEYKCNSGFFLLGSNFSVCQQNRMWSSEEPKCLGPNDFDNRVEISDRLKHIVQNQIKLQEEELEKYRNTLLMLTNQTNFTSLSDLEMFVFRTRTIDMNYPGRIILYFIFDTSGSVGPDNFNASVQFAKALVRKIGVTPKGTRVGALSFSSEAVVQFMPVELTTTEEVIDALDNMPYNPGGTATTASLEKLIGDVMPLTKRLLGTQTKSYIFILTDGKANMGGDPQTRAAELKEAGVEIYCIGITGSFVKSSLYKIASPPSEEHVFILDDYSSISYLIQAVINGTIDYSECGLGLQKVSSRHEQKQGDNRGRIIGGEKAVEPWPWMAALYISNDVKGGIHGAELKCGGSIVGRQWILTAAHCMVDKANGNKQRDKETIIVKLGLVNVKNQSNLLEFGPEKYIIHPDYDPETLDYDIAMIKLDRLIEFSSFVRPICLPPEELPLDTSLYRERENVFITGWGHDKKRGQQQVVKIKTVDHLKELRLPIQSEERCRTSLKNKPFVFTERMFCAGSGAGEVDTCQGDSGGPVMQSQLNEEGNVYWVQMGIVSWGIGCGVPNTYGFYTHVHRLRSWILQIMSSN